MATAPVTYFTVRFCNVSSFFADLFSRSIIKKLGAGSQIMLMSVLWETQMKAICDYPAIKLFRFATKLH